MITYDQLNENQRRAADWTDGPVLVLAGPGSGKTAVLTLRVARLLEEDENAAALALTVTDKAATEMRERVHELLGERTDRAKLCTFHSLAIDILGQHGSHLGIRPDFLPLSQDEDRIALLDEVIHDLPDVGGHIPADRRNLLRLIDGVFGEGEAGDGASPSLSSRHRWLPRLFRRYCDAMVHANRLDFGSLLFFAARLLREKPMVARVVRLGWTHICVDEFQDTNRAQYDLLRLLAPARDHNLFVVADDDQIIYQWNGASPKRFQDLRGDYDVRVIALPENYRCPPGIVSLANRLIERNATRVTRKKTVAVREKRGRYAEVVRFRSFPSPEQEADFVARDIRERELPAPECVVLARTNRLVKDAANTLRRAGHDAHVPVRKNEFDSPALSVLMEALRLASSPHDRVVLRRLCLAWGGLTGNDIDAQSVEAAAALEGGDFLRAWLDVAASGDNVGYEGACERIRGDLVDGLRFPQVVVDFLGGEWRSWSGDGVRQGDRRGSHHLEGSARGSRGRARGLRAAAHLPAAVGPVVEESITIRQRAAVHDGTRREGARIQPCVPDRDGAGGVPVVPGAQEGRGERGGRGRAPELFRRDNASAGDADDDRGEDVFRVSEASVPVSGGDGGDGGPVK